MKINIEEVDNPLEYLENYVNKGYVLHGSTRKISGSLKPTLSNDLTKEFGNQKAVYLTSCPLVAMFCALTSGADVGHRVDSKRTVVDEEGRFTYTDTYFGVENIDRVSSSGYVYIFPKSVVDDTEGLEHISKKEIKPKYILGIKREDFKYEIEEIKE